MQLVQDGDVINLTNHVAIKPDNTFPNYLGVWEPFVVDKAITIDGGALQNKLSFERGLPLEDVQDLSFFLYPNPASKEFSFNHPERVCSVKIYDINGRLVRYFPQKSSYQIYGLPKGLYFIIVEHADGRSRFKLKKE